MNAVEEQHVDNNSKINVANLQILNAIMTLGIVAWMGYVAFGTNALSDPRRPAIAVWTIIGAGFAGIAVLLRLFIANMMELTATTKPEQDEEDLPANREKLISIYQRQSVVSLILFASAAGLNINATFYEHYWASLGVASVLVIGMVALFPSEESAEKWIQKRISRDV
jgi:hypothetical protein